MGRTCVAYIWLCQGGGGGDCASDGNYGQNNVYFVDQMTSILIASTHGAICFLEKRWANYHKEPINYHKGSKSL